MSFAAADSTRRSRALNHIDVARAESVISTAMGVTSDDVTVVVEVFTEYEAVDVNMKLREEAAANQIVEAVATPEFTTEVRVKLGVSSVSLSTPPTIEVEIVSAMPLAPPPPPHSPPLPPAPLSRPPLAGGLTDFLTATIPEWLNVQDYANVSNPAAAALGAMLRGPEAAPARTAAAVIVAASVAKSVGSSVASSAGGGAAGAGSSGVAAALPSLMMAQRFALMGRLGGAPKVDVNATSEPDPTAWMTGRVSFFSSAPASGSLEAAGEGGNAIGRLPSCRRALAAVAARAEAGADEGAERAAERRPQRMTSPLRTRRASLRWPR